MTTTITIFYQARPRVMPGFMKMNGHPATKRFICVHGWEA